MTVFICGDSTAASYREEETCMTGWGQVLGRFLPGMDIDNRAMAGRSTRTFLAEGRLAAIEPQLVSGDLLLVQFGHNDGGRKPERHTEPWTDFTANLCCFLEAAEAHSAVPVLLTPICVRNWEHGVLQSSHGEYVDAVRALAEKRSVRCIDLYTKSMEIVAGLGEMSSKTLYLHLIPGQDIRHPEGMEDNTHTSIAGALCYAEIVAEHLRMFGFCKESGGA